MQIAFILTNETLYIFIQATEMRRLSYVFVSHTPLVVVAARLCLFLSLSRHFPGPFDVVCRYSVVVRCDYAFVVSCDSDVVSCGNYFVSCGDDDDALKIQVPIPLHCWV